MSSVIQSRPDPTVRFTVNRLWFGWRVRVV
jgi:hypothetical protein